MSELEQPPGFALWVPGRPRPMPRPRATTRGGDHASVYYASKRKGGKGEALWIGWKRAIMERLLYHRQGLGPFRGPVHVTLAFWFAAPLVRVIGEPAGTGPDLDNLEKLVLDALHSEAMLSAHAAPFLDDRQVSALASSKWYGRKEHQGLLLMVAPDDGVRVDSPIASVVPFGDALKDFGLDRILGLDPVPKPG